MFFLLCFLQFSCGSRKSHVKKTSVVQFNCENLKEILENSSERIKRDFANRNGLYSYLANLGFSKYSFGVEKNLKLKDENIELNDSLVQKVNVYHKFQNETNNSEVIFYEIMEHEKDQKYKQTSLIICYFQGIDLELIKTCSLKKYGSLKFSKRNLLIVKMD